LAKGRVVEFHRQAALDACFGHSLEEFPKFARRELGRFCS
jgi:hypothetical protein